MAENICCKNKYVFIIPRMGNGGAERVMATLANELSTENNKVLILSLTTNESFYDLNDNVEIIGAGYEVSRNNKVIRSINMLVNGLKSFFPAYSQNKIRIIENSINLSSISDESTSARKKAIVGVGRLFEQKNFALLIDSFNEIKDEFPEHILEIYGEGHLREQLQNQIDNLGLSDRVYLKGVKNNVMKYISDSELFVILSNFEGFPNALIEAMASGMPVISTDFSTGVARDLIKKENGIVVPVGDCKSMSQAMREILSNKGYQETASIENRKIKDLLSPKAIMNKWMQAFEEINKKDLL